MPARFCRPLQNLSIITVGKSCFLLVLPGAWPFLLLRDDVQSSFLVKEALISRQNHVATKRHGVPAFPVQKPAQR